MQDGCPARIVPPCPGKRGMEHGGMAGPENDPDPERPFLSPPFSSPLFRPGTGVLEQRCAGHLLRLFDFHDLENRGSNIGKAAFP